LISFVFEVAEHATHHLAVNSTVDYLQVLPAFFVFYIPFYLHRVEQTFEEVFKEGEERVIGEDSIRPLANGYL
jgi:hypothetical protein